VFAWQDFAAGRATGAWCRGYRSLSAASAADVLNMKMVGNIGIMPARRRVVAVA